MKRLCFGLALCLAAAAANAQLRAGGEYNSTYANIGIKGYDPVAYFKVGKSVKGSERYSVDYGGVTWHFSSAENRDAFKASPAARLDFFYRRHPAFDQRWNLLPVYRTEVPVSAAPPAPSRPGPSAP